MIPLAEIRNYLDITWYDPDLDTKLGGIRDRCAAWIESRCGPLDYDSDAEAAALLLDYIRYVRDGAGKDFGADYRRDIIHLQCKLRASQEAETDG